MTQSTRSYRRGGTASIGGGVPSRIQHDDDVSTAASSPEEPIELEDVATGDTPVERTDESSARHRHEEPLEEQPEPDPLFEQEMIIYDGAYPQQFVDNGHPTLVWDCFSQIWVPRPTPEALAAMRAGVSTTVTSVPRNRYPDSWAPVEKTARRAWIKANKNFLPLPPFPQDEHYAAMHEAAIAHNEPLRLARLQTERDAIRQRVLDNHYEFTMTILIVSWRGGAGKTQTTAELSAIIRRELVRLMAVVAAMDGNVDFGMLLYRLGIEDDSRAKNTMMKTAKGIEELNSLKAMLNMLPVSPEGVIAVPLDFKSPETRALSKEELDLVRYQSLPRVHQRMCYGATYILIDGGTGDNGITRASREVAELIILPGHLDKEGYQQIKELLTDLYEDVSTRDLVARTIILVMNYDASQEKDLNRLKAEYLGPVTEHAPIKVGAVRTLSWDPAAAERQVANPDLLDPQTYNQFFELVATGHEVLRGKRPRRQLPLYIPAELAPAQLRNESASKLEAVPALPIYPVSPLSDELPIRQPSTEGSTS